MDRTSGEHEAPRGDADRTAIDALRGYAFQVYGSVLAWTMLAEGEVLHLEIAEDFATASKDALDATQAKDTKGSGSVTLNTPGVRQAIVTLVDLTALNPGRTVRLRYMSTSVIGVEARVADRVEGGAGLAYWRRVAAGRAEAGPLLERLRGMALAPQAGLFMADRNDDELRRDLVDRIDWDCGRGGIDSLQLEIAARLTRPGGVQGQRVGIADVERVVGALVRKAFETATKPDGRSLTAFDLRRAIHDATHVTLPQAQFSGLLRLVEASGQHRRLAFGTPEMPLGVERIDGLPFPRLLLDRPRLVAAVGQAMADDGVGIVLGGLGVGKTLVARLAARVAGGAWHVVDLQAEGGGGSAERLRGLVSRIEDLGTAGLLIEDFDASDDPAARRALSALVAAMGRGGWPCLVTTHRDPPRELLDAIGGDRRRIVRVGHLDEGEVRQLVVLGGGRHEWGRLAWLASDGGHPRLAQAVVTDLAARGWSKEALAEYLGADIPVELRRERTDARKRLLATVGDEGSRAFLYRASLALGRFDRGMAFAMGAVEPATGRPGEALDRLVGPWIDEVAPDWFRVSPLLGDAGRQALSPDEQSRTHAALAAAIMAGGSIDIAQADALLHHGLGGKVETALYAIGAGLVWADVDQRRTLAEWSVVLRNLSTETPAYPEAPFVSTMLRLAQFVALVAVEGDEALEACLVALLRELPATRAAGGHPLEALVLAHVLTERRADRMVGDGWPDLLVRLAGLLEGRPEVADAGPDGSGPTLLGLACSVHLHTATDIAGLGALFDRIDRMAPDARAVLLRAASEAIGGLELILRRPLMEEQERGGLRWREALGAYSLMAGQAAGWGARELALRCWATSAMLADEFGRAPDEALRLLDGAERDLGADGILTRAKGRVLGRRGDHAGALPLLEASLGDPRDGDVERAFLLRDIGVAAASLGRHALARDSFRDASHHAAAVGSPMSIMAIGLAADAAVQDVTLGRGREAVVRFQGCIDDLEGIDPRRDAKATYVHRLVGYVVLWAFAELTGQDIPLPEGPVRILPGMCSVPEPSAGYGDGPMPPLATFRYMLAITDLECNLDAGIDARLDAGLAGRTLPRSEVMLQQARMSRTIRCCDALAFAEALPRWVDAQAFRVGGAWRDDVGHWREAALPHVDARDWGRPDLRGSVLAAVMAFALVAVTTGRPACLDALDGCLDQLFPEDGLRVAASRLTRRVPCDDALPPGLPEAMHLMEAVDPRDPTLAMAISIRLFEAAIEVAEHGFAEVVGPSMAGWIGSEWSGMANLRRFALVSPSSTAPAIVDAVRRSTDDMASSARIVLAALPAVRLRLDPGLRAQLSSWAGVQ